MNALLDRFVQAGRNAYPSAAQPSNARLLNLLQFTREIDGKAAQSLNALSATAVHEWK
jgi:hypothetical protein